MMRAFPLSAVLMLFSFGGSVWSQAFITIHGTVRDFRAAWEVGGHPDFESSISGHVPGIVEGTLGADGLPVYAHGAASYGGVANESSFASWFRDTPGVNLSTSHSITLTETSLGSGTYAYTDSAFFPIDGQLYGNYAGFSHNYHFTYELRGVFDFNAGTGQVFSFSGDDDVWVFIDNSLAIDLGGVHSPISGSVGLDTFLAGKPSGTYDFAMFFAERHTTGSNFGISTTLRIVPEPSAMAFIAVVSVWMPFFRRSRILRS